MHGNEILSTFSIAAALGVCLFTIANHFQISAIVVLLIGGVLAGPQCLGIVQPDALGEGLATIISLSVAIILFEGGLTLDLKGYRTVSKEIWRILTVGVVVTWFCSAVLVRLLFGFAWPFCILAASLVIVTGPTVIGPLLHRIRVKEKLHHILHWEGVLIDPIGVFIALLSFEFFVSVDGAQQIVIQDFVLRFAIGVMVGIAFGFLLDFMLRQEWVEKDHTNIFVLAMAMLNFAVADVVISESGLLSVTVAGLVLGNRTAPQLRGIVKYKVELKDFLIGLLFVLLAANLNLAAFLDYGWKLMLVVVAIMLVVRPLNVFASTAGSALTLNEKLFLGWIAPRGIVAASMASLFALRLSHEGVTNAVFLETFTYSVIAGTVIVQGFSAGLIGRILNVVQPVPTGWIIVGAHNVGRKVAGFLKRHGLDVVLVDTNARCVREARRDGFEALTDDALKLKPDQHAAFYACGNLLALTSNSELNQVLCRRWSELLDGSVYRWAKTTTDDDKSEDPLAGQPVWQQIPLSRSMHPDDNSIRLRIQPAVPSNPQSQDDNLPESNHVLMTWDGSKMLPGKAAVSDAEKAEWLLFDARNLLDQERDLPLLLDHVLFPEPSELKPLYKTMLQSLQQLEPYLDYEDLLEELWRHEEEFTSLVGHGIALPHVRVKGIEQSTLVVARPQGELECPLTQQSIELIFMLLSPLEKPEEHLRHLANIAQLVGTEEKRIALLGATSPYDLYDAIMSR